MTMNELEQKKYWTLDELAHYTGYTKSYIYKLTHRNEIPYYKLLGKLMFAREDIYKLLQENRVKSTAELEQEIL